MSDTIKYYDAEVSEYGIKNNRVDLAALGYAVGGILNLNIVRMTASAGLGEWEVRNGSLYYHCDCEGNWYSDQKAQERIDELESLIDEADEDQEENILAWKEDIKRLEECEERDIYQCFIVSYSGARILMEDTDEIVLYNEKLDMYVWCVTVFGTPWEDVLTNILLKNPEQAA